MLWLGRYEVKTLGSIFLSKLGQHNVSKGPVAKIHINMSTKLPRVELSGNRDYYFTFKKTVDLCYALSNLPSSS